MSADRLVMFVYLLLRDELPCGVVERVVHDVEHAHGAPVFSAKHLEAYAREIVERLQLLAPEKVRETTAIA